MVVSIGWLVVACLACLVIGFVGGFWYRREKPVESEDLLQEAHERIDALEETVKNLLDRF